MKSKSALIILAREPREGKVKTRLSKDLPLPVVLRLYKAFVKDVLNISLNVQCDQRFIYYAGSSSSIPFLRRIGGRFQLKRQAGKDLGERMYRALCYCQKNKFDRIVIIGTDCLTVTSREIEKALKKLNTHDCVLGPSTDGGYYLIALKSVYIELFKGIRWGTSAVLAQTLKKIKLLDKKVYLLNKHNDIDTVNDLKKFTRDSKNTKALHTQKILKKFPVNL